jgi:hypothetical protein
MPSLQICCYAVPHNSFASLLENISMHSLHGGTIIFPYQSLERRVTQESLMCCTGMHNLKLSKALRIHSVCNFVLIFVKYMLRIKKSGPRDSRDITGEGINRLFLTLQLWSFEIGLLAYARFRSSFFLISFYSAFLPFLPSYFCSLLIYLLLPHRFSSFFIPLVTFPHGPFTTCSHLNYHIRLLGYNTLYNYK